MVTLLAKIFIKDSEDKIKQREAYGMLCGVIGILFNVLLFIGKFLAGTLSNSIAITADAFNNLSDAGSSIVTLLGFKLAGAKPDTEHPFGHGRIEYVSGLVVAAAILLMGYELVRDSIGKIMHPEETEFTLLVAVILIASILVKLYMAYYNRAIGKKLDSAAMKAVATDSLSDTAATTVVLLASVFTHFTGIKIDGYCGLVVGLLVGYAGFDAARETLNPLLGQPPAHEFVEKIDEIVMSHSEVCGMHDLIVHDYGPGRQMISLHAEVPAEGNILELHDVIDNIENELREHGSGVQDGKWRIIELYQTQPDRKLRAKALAKEYGIGGHSQDFLDGSSGFVNHDGKGLEFDHYPDHQKVTLSWTQVEKYIDLMIQSDRYLTDKEKEHRAAVQEAERQLPMLDGDAAAEYNALKEQYPNTLIGFELGGYFLFYDKDAITVKEVFRSNLLSQENALGKVKVTGFLRREWVAKSQKLWAEGNSIYLAGQGGDGTHHQTKYLREEDYLPIGIIIKLDGRDFRVDHVNFMFKSVSLQDMDLTNSGQPIFRVERLPNIRELYEQQQDEIIDVSPEKAVDYKVGDDVIVDLPTRTIEGKIGYVGETDVRIDTSAHGQSWDNEVINKRQFEDGLRQKAELLVPLARIDERRTEGDADEL